MTHEMTKEEEQRAQKHIDDVGRTFACDDDPDLPMEPSWWSIICLWILLIGCWIIGGIWNGLARIRR